MRAFLACPPEAEWRHRATAEIGRLRILLQPGGRYWCHPEDLHLTLCFFSRNQRRTAGSPRLALAPGSRHHTAVHLGHRGHRSVSRQPSATGNGHCVPPAGGIGPAETQSAPSGQSSRCGNRKTQFSASCHAVSAPSGSRSGGSPATAATAAGAQQTLPVRKSRPLGRQRTPLSNQGLLSAERHPEPSPSVNPMHCGIL